MKHLEMSQQERVAFVLSGGSNRGALQAGALEVLLRAGLEPDLIVGSSVGALNGAYLAENPTLAGVKRLQEIYVETDFNPIFGNSPMEMVLRAVQGELSLYRNEHLVEMIRAKFDAIRFQELAAHCYVVATDLDTGEPYVFGDSPDDRVLDGLMSSAAITPLHPPWQVNGRFYADGGFVAMLPVMEAIERGATQIIALNLADQLMPPEQRTTVLDMTMHAIDLMTRGQVHTTLRRARQQNGVRLKVINLAAEVYVPFNDMSRMSELVDSGRRVAQKALDLS